MSNRFIVFDVETPNEANDRISAIGISIIENNEVIENFYSLVNPEAHFKPFNIQLTGITPEMVADKPAFSKLWKQIEPIMNSGLLVAHNARFDMNVLAKCLYDYSIDWQPYAYYACTCVMGRACYPELENHKLNTLCEHLQINLDHHNAGSDSQACASLLLNYISLGFNPDHYIGTFDLYQRRTSKKYIKPKLGEKSKQLLSLKKILSSITADGILSESEVISLKEWMDQNIALLGNFPFDKIFETVGLALNDGILEQNELDEMLDLFENLSDPVANTCCNGFDISGRTFCLTGDFGYGERSKVESTLIQRGGIPVSNVTRKTDYVIVGSIGSNLWSQGNYGNKVKRALELQENGFHIKIIKELDISSLLND